MKKIIFYLLTVVISMGAVAQTRKVAILDAVDLENSLSYGIKLMIRGQLAEAVTNTPGYEAYDRTNLQQIFDEQEFQRTGLVSDADIKKIGEMTGVQYVLVTEASKLDDKNMFITAKILNVETARVEKNANVTAQMDIQSLQKGTQDLASRLLSDIKQTAHQKPKSVVVSKGACIERISSFEYSIGGEMADMKAYYKFIKDNSLSCIPAYKQFKQGEQMALSGWCLLGIGLPTFFVGTGILVKGEATLTDNDYSMIWTGAGVMIAGGVITLTSIPLLSVGYFKKNNAYQLYNEHCAPKKKDAISLNLQASGNGLGLALHF